ncbi:MAG: 6-phospho-3-hexuloisomerase [Methanocellales archaeon]|nr:6-phospho-3-hexuloisomerase [Methanocellales archaeon]MDD3291476.1 6-phospho-3-hexuloisomerase [Methanocellales archaeon]MDD5234634.1 6-phospho-3-hexuloisomerase [Methanocellales archaeon]MDD5485013.1 6-phospho-3-hexuloisomerase [Methanocellales archaeon]
MPKSKDENQSTVRSAMKMMSTHIIDAAEDLKDDTIKEVIDQLLSAKKIFLLGVGRSGLVGKAFAMRLMHLGFRVFVVGETITPSVEKGDLLVVISGSGETQSVVDLAQIGKDLGAKIILVTSNPNSTAASYADILITLGKRVKTDDMDYLERQVRGAHRSLAPLGTLFEITSMVFLDGIIAALMEITKKGEGDLKLKHATLE